MPATAHPISPLRRLFAKREDPYAGADHALACRLGGALWLVASPMALLLLLLAPPDAAVGGWGWPIAIATSAFGIVGGLWMRSGTITWNQLLATSYVATVQIALLNWLAGGNGQPYPELFFIVAIFAGAVHPPRRVVGVLAAIGVASASPLIYTTVPAEGIGLMLLRFILVLVLGLLASALMSAVRAQRLGLRDRGDQAEQRARIDELTGLWNRRAFTEALTAEVARARRDGAPLTFLLGDLDRFKDVNDTEGHAAGDACLRAVSDALRSTLRAGDTCFRWGGDEFALLLPQTTLAEADEVCRRVEEAVDGCRAAFTTPVSITCAAAELHDGMSADDLVEAADAQLLALKRASRLSRTASAA